MSWTTNMNHAHKIKLDHGVDVFAASESVSQRMDQSQEGYVYIAEAYPLGPNKTPFILVGWSTAAPHNSNDWIPKCYRPRKRRAWVSVQIQGAARVAHIIAGLLSRSPLRSWNCGCSHQQWNWFEISAECVKQIAEAVCQWYVKFEPYSRADCSLNMDWRLRIEEWRKPSDSSCMLKIYDYFGLPAWPGMLEPVRMVDVELHLTQGGQYDHTASKQSWTDKYGDPRISQSRVVPAKVLFPEEQIARISTSESLHTFKPISNVQTASNLRNFTTENTFKTSSPVDELLNQNQISHTSSDASDHVQENKIEVNTPSRESRKVGHTLIGNSPAISQVVDNFERSWLGIQRENNVEELKLSYDRMREASQAAQFAKELTSEIDTYEPAPVMSDDVCLAKGNMDEQILNTTPTWTKTQQTIFPHGGQSSSSTSISEFDQSCAGSGIVSRTDSEQVVTQAHLNSLETRATETTILSDETLGRTIDMTTRVDEDCVAHVFPIQPNPIQVEGTTDQVIQVKEESLESGFSTACHPIPTSESHEVNTTFFSHIEDELYEKPWDDSSVMTRASGADAVPDQDQTCRSSFVDDSTILRSPELTDTKSITAAKSPKVKVLLKAARKYVSAGATSLRNIGQHGAGKSSETKTTHKYFTRSKARQKDLQAPIEGPP